MLRGPQWARSTAKASLGGTIRYITHQAELDRFDANIDSIVSGTEHGGTNYSVGAMVNAPLVDGALAVRGELQHREDSGYIDNVPLGIGQFNKSHTDEARLKATLKASDDLTIRASGMYQGVTQGGPNVASLDAPRGVLRELRYRARLHATDYLYQSALTAEYRTPWANIQSATSYFHRATHLDVQARADELYDDATPFPLYSLIDTSSPDTDRGAARLLGAGGTVQMGGRLLLQAPERAGQNENDYDTTSSGAFIDNIYQNETFRQEAVFGELTYSMTQALSASARTAVVRRASGPGRHRGGPGISWSTPTKVIPKLPPQYQLTAD